ncbi:hypothetical protein ACS3QZ_02690 [Shimia sp. W99]
MTDNVHYLPNYEPPQEPPELPVVRVVLVPAPAPPVPLVTPMGLVVAVLCGVVSFALVSAVLS